MARFRPGKKRLASLCPIWKTANFLPLIWLLRDSLALKWFLPGLRAKTLPLRVTFKRLEYDLLVFIPLEIGQRSWIYLNLI